MYPKYIELKDANEEQAFRQVLDGAAKWYGLEADANNVFFFKQKLLNAEQPQVEQPPAKNDEAEPLKVVKDKKDKQ